MAFDETLSERIECVLDNKLVEFEAKKMFGGICFIVEDKMCVGVVKDSLMLRIDRARQSERSQKLL